MHFFVEWLCIKVFLHPDALLTTMTRGLCWSNVILYCLLHAGLARELPLPLPCGSWPLQRYTSSILHITNVSSASAAYVLLLMHLKSVSSLNTWSLVWHVNCMVLFFTLWFTSFNDTAHTPLEKNKPLSILSLPFSSPFFLFLEHTCTLFPFNLISTSFYVFPLYSIVVVLFPPPCICRLRLLFVFFPLLQVFLSTPGSSQSGDHVWSPAASILPHRALWCWAHTASATGSSPQTLL